MLSRGRTGGLRLAGAAFLVAAGLPLAGPVPAACAGEAPRAVLVVDTGEAVHRMCVQLPRSSVSGTDLIELAGDQHGLTYRFGYGGGAVCMLAGVGATGDDCFEKHPDFWGYWRGNDSGGWSWSSTGAGSTRVSDGDVEGWSWGSGNDGSSHPAPPHTTFSSVCAASPRPKPKPKPKPQPREDGDAASGDGEASGGPQGPRRRDAGATAQTASPPRARPGPAARDATGSRRLDRERGRSRRDRAGRGPRRGASTTAATLTPGSLEDHAPTGATGSPGAAAAGPPAAGLAGLGVAALLSGAGLWQLRRRRRMG